MDEANRKIRLVAFILSLRRLLPLLQELKGNSKGHSSKELKGTQQELRGTQKGTQHLFGGVVAIWIWIPYSEKIILVSVLSTE